MNSKIKPLYIERYSKISIENPEEAIFNLGLKTFISDFSEMSVKTYGNEKMVNFLMGQKTISEKLLPFNLADFEETFQSLIAMKQIH